MFENSLRSSGCQRNHEGSGFSRFVGLIIKVMARYLRCFKVLGAEKIVKRLLVSICARRNKWCKLYFSTLSIRKVGHSSQSDLVAKT